MPSWNDILIEVRAGGSIHDVVRRKYLAELHQLTGRNVIVYYSGWLQKGEVPRPGFTGFMVNDSDKNGFMAAIYQLDKTMGLDLILHTPGGETAATESIVDYLRSMFGTDIRAVIPQIAMSAGTMIALACREVIMASTPAWAPLIHNSMAFLPMASLRNSNVRAMRSRPIQRGLRCGSRSLLSTTRRSSESVRSPSNGPMRWLRSGSLVGCLRGRMALMRRQTA